MDTSLYPIIWFGLIGFGLIMYVVLDGFSLGIGILFPFFIKEEKQRDIMMTTVSPVWDGNQTWLVLSAAGLYGVFPLVYATLLPAMYLPLILMLMCLFYRGMTFEFRFKTAPHLRKWYDMGFCGVTIVVAFIQGMIVGSVIGGIEVVGGRYVGGPLDWFTWFGLCTGVALVIGYALLGAGWLIVKTKAPLQQRCYRLMKWLMVLFMLSMIAVAIWTPLANEAIARRWFSFPNVLGLGAVAVLMLLLAANIGRGIARQQEKLLFVQIVALFVLGSLGLVASLFPVMVPPDLTLWEASSHRSSQEFLLIGYVILIPIILAYTTFSYRVFRGKVCESEE